MGIHPDYAEQVYKQWFKSHKKDEKAVIFYLKEALNKRLGELLEGFPDSTFHTVAIKTQSEPKVLQHIVTRGFGLEAASFEEVKLAKEAGAPDHKIVFDSPVKTSEEIQQCHQKFPGITLNANSIQELGRYPKDFSGKIGLRVNPLEDSDAPGIFNLSSFDSKFGVPISQRNEIIEACLRHSNITGLHVHIGSGIKNFQNNINAVQKLKTLADEINELRKKHHLLSQIKFIDIGGGIQFDNENIEFSVKAFAEKLQAIPDLFESYQIITEYGNFVHKNNSFVVSNIEYIVPKGEGNPSLVYIHVGADLFLRKVYSSLAINYPVHGIYENQSAKDTQHYKIAGPLCFEGDILFDDVELPTLTEKDKLMILNIGANTLSMWSWHCNRNIPEFVFI